MAASPAVGILQLNTPEKKDSLFLHNGPQLQGDENEGGERHEDEQHVPARWVAGGGCMVHFVVVQLRGWWWWEALW